MGVKKGTGSVPDIDKNNQLHPVRRFLSCFLGSTQGLPPPTGSISAELPGYSTTFPFLAFQLESGESPHGEPLPVSSGTPGSQEDVFPCVIFNSCVEGPQSSTRFLQHSLSSLHCGLSSTTFTGQGP